jgi:2-amino-4-hydroxy-6-hydroxymethyldihydropteridine diphosphokinase
MPDAPETAYLLLGSNIEPEKHLQWAITALRAHCQVVALSSVYRSPAYGPVSQPDFMNVAVKVTTDLPPAAFKERLLRIEADLGRDRAAQKTKFDPRTLDIDIALWGNRAFSYGTKPWQVPDENILDQPAVALPLAELAPDYLHPQEQVTLAEIASRFGDDHDVRVFPLSLD